MQMAYTAGKMRNLRRKRVREERFIGKRSKLHTRRQDRQTDDGQG